MRTRYTSAVGHHPLHFIALSALWLATVANVPLWRKLAELPELQNIRGLGFAAAFGLALFFFNFASISLLGWHRLLKPVLIFFFVSAAIGAYFMVSCGIVIDSTMVVNVMQTDLREASDLLNWRMAAYLLILGMAPSVLVWRSEVRELGGARLFVTQFGIAVLALIAMFGVLLLIYQDFSSIMRNHTQVRYLVNPINSFYAVGKIAFKHGRTRDGVIQPLGADARLAALRPGDKPPLLLIVLGETARTASLGINGYVRQTTPRLSQENIISLRNVWSCGTSTAASLPCMFSNLGRDGFDDRPANTENLMDVLYRAGLAVLWLDNQSGCKGVCDRVPTYSTASLKAPEFCDSGECFDEVMLRGIDQRINESPNCRLSGARAAWWL